MRKPEVIDEEFFDFLTDTFVTESKTILKVTSGTDYERTSTVHRIGDGSKVLEERIREYPGGTVSNFLRY